MIIESPPLTQVGSVLRRMKALNGYGGMKLSAGQAAVADLTLRGFFARLGVADPH